MPEFRVASCSHGADVCDGCHREFVRASRTYNTDTATGDVHVACMTRGCDGGYRADALFRLFPDRVARDALFERLSLARFERLSNAVYCTRERCGALLTFEAEPDAVCTSLVCRRCANAMCLSCKRDAHDGVSCADYAESSAGWTSEKLINAISRRCPRCMFRIFREGGCPHMTCSQCSFQFCYGCLGDRATYRAGAHEGCDSIAAQFEREGFQVLSQIRLQEIAARRQARINARAERRRVARIEREERERAAALARTFTIVEPSEEDIGFDLFGVFASLDEQQVEQQVEQPVVVEPVVEPVVQQVEEQVAVQRVEEQAKQVIDEQVELLLDQLMEEEMAGPRARARASRTQLIRSVVLQERRHVEQRALRMSA